MCLLHPYPCLCRLNTSAWKTDVYSMSNSTFNASFHIYLCVCLRCTPQILSAFPFSDSQTRYTFSACLLKSHHTFTFYYWETVWESFSLFSTMRIYDPASIWLTAAYRHWLPNFISPKIGTPLVVVSLHQFQAREKNTEIQNLFILNHKCSWLHRRIVRLCFSSITVFVQNKPIQLDSQVNSGLGLKMV